MKSYLSLIVCVLSFLWITPVMAAGDLSSDLQSGEFWKKPIQEIGRQFLQGERMRWVDESKSVLRLPKSKICLGEMSLGEILLSLKDGKPVSMTIMVYNKGDQGAIDKKEFEEKLKESMDCLTKLSGVEPKPYKVGRGETAVKLQAWSWTWSQGAISLEASTSKDGREFEAEFIRLKMGASTQAITRVSSNARLEKADLLKHVKKTGKRVIIEGIPMVDQGEKGYCVVATASRIFAYYGMNFVDQHELASIANSSGDGGTTTSSMAQALKKIGSRFQVRVRDIDGINDLKSYQKFAREYNRAARREKKEMLPDTTHDLGEMWTKVDADVLKAARAGNQGQMDRWMKPVRDYVSTGVPVLWCVHLGIVPEPVGLFQTRGGHMRMIIGYDDDKKTLIFSDSWGAEHTAKEMPLQDAISITTSRMALQPGK
ncbi:MAG: C39 family peptidase [Akkermansia sp.]